VRVFSRQQAVSSRHQTRLMFNLKPQVSLTAILIVSLGIFLTGCISPKDKVTKARLLETSNATKADLIEKVNSLTAVDSINAKMYLKFEDNSYAEVGIAEKYKTADSTIVVQRPEKINLKVEVPIIGTDIVQMTSNGDKFRVAVLNDGGSGKYVSFLMGTNGVDYSPLEKQVSDIGSADSSEVKKNISAFSNLRPQHFNDVMLIRALDDLKYIYVQSAIVQEEYDVKTKKKSPLKWVLRGYYLLDELKKNPDGKMFIARRFWFDRVGGVNLSRQQVFDTKGEIESDIIYGKLGALTETGEYQMPLEVELTRPKEKYRIRLIYKAPSAVKIGKAYKDNAFLLENTRNLREIDLDKKLYEMKNGKESRTSLIEN